MIEKEVVYERTISGSYMKIAAAMNAKFDEKMMLKRKLKGILAVEQCYFNGNAWYWYNISGKQSLDTYCKIHSIGADMIKKIIISICDEIETLEFNLLNPTSLVLEPEYIFIHNISKEVLFTIYPGNRDDISMQFQQLMEYLLTKIDHSDMDAVRTAYDIYEKSLDPAYSLKDLRDSFLAEKNEKVREENFKERKTQDTETENSLTFEQTTDSTKSKKVSEMIFREMIQILSNWKKSISENIHKLYQTNSGNGEKEAPIVTYPEDKVIEEKAKIYPTVCLSEVSMHPKGILLYEGDEGISNIQLCGKGARIGASFEAEVQIEKPTISKFHAKIDCEDEEYYIEDLNSTNGTFVNGQALSYKERKKLQAEDVVKFADTRFRFI